MSMQPQPLRIAACLVSIALLPLGAPGKANPTSDNVPAADNQAIDVMASDLFAQLTTGRSLSAINGFLGRSKLMALKPQQTTLLASQIDTAITVYGPIFKCLKYSQSERAGVLEKRSYICQHQNFLTRWNLAFGKTGNGWEPLNIDFDDKVTEDLE